MDLRRDWWKLTAVVVVGLVLAFVGTSVASNLAPTSPVAVATSTTDPVAEPVVETTVQSLPLATIARGQSAPSTTEKAVGPPNLEIDETLLDFGDSEVELALRIVNRGESPGDWELTELEEFVIVAPESGELGPGEAIEVMIGIDRAVVPEGEFGSEFRFEWGDESLEMFLQGVHNDNPIIIRPTASPATVMADTGSGCTPAKTKVTVRVKDNSEMASVIVRWSVGGSNPKETEMSQVDEENWEATIGPFPAAGDADVKIVATDVFDNAGGAPAALTVEPCA